MKNQTIGITVNSIVYSAEQRIEVDSLVPEHLYLMPASYCSSKLQKNRKHPLFHWMNKFTSKANSYAKGICDHVSKGKLSFGMRILQAGGVGRIFRQNFYVNEGEKLLDAFQCYLSTTAGPIPGFLFISSEKIAFCSNRCIKLSFSGEIARVPYKVLIPLNKTNRVCQSENINKPSQKYIQIITEDKFEFWFMGFLSYKRFFNFIQKQIQREQ